MMSPFDEPITPGALVRFEDGPVFQTRLSSITVTVNNKLVRFTKRRVTGLEIKRKRLIRASPSTPRPRVALGFARTRSDPLKHAPADFSNVFSRQTFVFPFTHCFLGKNIV
jgi:hypothetical protein